MFSNNDIYQDNTFDNNGAGVAVMFSKEIKMLNNIFRENWGSASYGLLLKEINDAEIIGNTFEENTIGINIEGSNRILYKNNNFTNNGWALKIRGACYTNTFESNNFLYNSFDLSYNTSTDNLRYGLHFMFSNNDIYQDNTFDNNGAGVAVMFSKEIKMLNNIFRENWGSASYGLLLKEINDAEIIGNTFEENTIGINIEGSNRILYKNNNFTNNGWALKIRGACYTNTFESNNFLYNSFDLSYNSKINDNIFNKNYWSNYTGYDLDKNNIGDVPYRPVKLFSYIVNRTPETIILLRSLFIDIIDFSEKVLPRKSLIILINSFTFKLFGKLAICGK